MKLQSALVAEGFNASPVAFYFETPLGTRGSPRTSCPVLVAPLADHISAIMCSFWQSHRSTAEARNDL